LGRSLQESTVVFAFTKVNGEQFLKFFPRFFGLLLDITAGKTVIFLAIFTCENWPDRTYHKVNILLSFIRNEGSLAQVCYSFYWQTDKDNALFKYC
jgi:hypothetical protein